MDVQPAPDPPTGDDLATVEAAHGLVIDLLYDLRGELLGRTGDIGHDIKRDGTPVTDVDVAVNERVVAAIADRFPDHAVVSEEMETHYAGARWTWVVDPVDGTSNFTAGLPYWCVAVALALDGLPVLAVVDSPPLDLRFEAIRGRGATRNGRPLSVRLPVDLDDQRNRHIPLFLTSGTVRRARPMVRLNPRVMGSAALDLCHVADGTGAAAISLIPKVWDVAAGSLLVQESGGVLVTLDGPPLLPLEPGTDYAGRSAPVCAAADLAFVERLTARLRPDDEDIFRKR